MILKLRDGHSPAVGDIHDSDFTVFRWGSDQLMYVLSMIRLIGKLTNLCLPSLNINRFPAATRPLRPGDEISSAMFLPSTYAIRFLSAYVKAIHPAKPFLNLDEVRVSISDRYSGGVQTLAHHSDKESLISARDLAVLSIGSLIEAGDVSTLVLEE